MIFIYRFDSESTAQLVASNLRKAGMATEVREVEGPGFKMYELSAEVAK